MDEKWKRRAGIFLFSQILTLFGSTLVQMALIWMATLETVSGRWVAVFSIGAYLPQCILSPLGGVWADRFSRKHLIILADAGIAFVTLGVVLWLIATERETAPLGVLLFMAVLRSAGAGIQTPAVEAVVPTLVPEEARLRFNSVNAGFRALVQFAAPVVAGIVWAVGNLTTTLMIDVVTAALGIAFLARLALPAPGFREQEKYTSLRQGVAYIRTEKLVARLLGLYGAVTFLCVPGGYLAGLYVARTFEASYGTLSVVEIVGFAGMLLGAFALSVWPNHSMRRWMLVWGLWLFGISAVGLGLAKTFSHYLALMFMYGVALTMVQTSLTTLLQETTVPEVQGRVFGVMSALYAAALPLGMAGFGVLADVCPLSGVIVASGIALVFLGFYAACALR